MLPLNEWLQACHRSMADVSAFGDAGQVWGDNGPQTGPAILANRDFESKNLECLDWRRVPVPVFENSNCPN